MDQEYHLICFNYLPLQSYGGQTSSHVIGRESDVFKCGIAVAPVISKRYYGWFYRIHCLNKHAMKVSLEEHEPLVTKLSDRTWWSSGKHGKALAWCAGGHGFNCQSVSPLSNVKCDRVGCYITMPAISFKCDSTISATRRHHHDMTEIMLKVTLNMLK